MRAQGHSYSKIAEQLDVSKPTLIKWSREHAVEIENLKAIGIEAIYVQHKATAQARAERLALLLAKTYDEILKRDLTSTPTDKLFVMFAKLCEMTSTEMSCLKLQETKGVFDAETDTHKWSL